MITIYWFTVDHSHPRMLSHPVVASRTLRAMSCILGDPTWAVKVSMPQLRQTEHSEVDAFCGDVWG